MDPGQWLGTASIIMNEMVQFTWIGSRILPGLVLRARSGEFFANQYQFSHPPVTLPEHDWPFHAICHPDLVVDRGQTPYEA
jgi:hypothetical protein